MKTKLMKLAAILAPLAVFLAGSSRTDEHRVHVGFSEGRGNR